MNRREFPCLDLSKLHDASLTYVQLLWSEAIIEVELVYFELDVRKECRLIGIGASGVDCPRKLPWGESQLINEVSFGSAKNASVVKIEMQSGDTISLFAESFSFDDRPKGDTAKTL